MYPDLVDNRSGGSLGSFLREYMEFLEGALWPFLALSGVLGLRLRLWAPLFLIRWWGEMVAFSCLILSQIGLILAELCQVTPRPLDSL